MMIEICVQNSLSCDINNFPNFFPTDFCNHTSFSLSEKNGNRNTHEA